MLNLFHSVTKQGTNTVPIPDRLGQPLPVFVCIHVELSTYIPAIENDGCKEGKPNRPYIPKSTDAKHTSIITELPKPNTVALSMKPYHNIRGGVSTTLLI